MAGLLIIFILLTPIISGVLTAIWRKNWINIVGSLLALLAIAGLWLSQQTTVITLPILIPGAGVSYGSQSVGLLLASVTTLVWFASSIFSGRYMQAEHNSSRFYLLFGFSVAGAISCFLARDFLGLLLGFEMMSLASYGLVAHNPNQPAQKAGRLYLYLGVTSGILLTIALVMLWHQVGTLQYTQLQNMPLTISVLLSLGFAIKAGAFPIHFWLPEAHPVAPSPGSALLSGILIKTGAFGLLQVASLTTAGRTYGLALILVALVTMSLGVLLALIQEDAKRMLAYHSVSQMGYILLGIGLWAFERNALGLGGAVFHIINHALFKSALFLICGSALLAAGTVNLYKLGFMRKVFGAATLLMLLPALGIAGVPGFNGYISKTLLHDALLHAQLTHGLLGTADKVFVLVAFGTVCSFIKFGYYVFFAERKTTQITAKASRAEVTGIGILSAFVLGLGIFPQPVLRALANGLSDLGVQLPTALELYGAHALQSTGMVLAGGTILYFVLHYTGLFHLHLPQQLSLLALITKVFNHTKAIGNSVFNYAAQLSARMSEWRTGGLRVLRRSLQALDYNPSSQASLRALSVTNLNFDVYVVMAVLSILLFFYPLMIGLR